MRPLDTGMLQKINGNLTAGATDQIGEDYCSFIPQYHLYPLNGSQPCCDQRGLCNSMKLWTLSWRTTQDGRVTVESSDKMWSTGGGNGKPLQYTCCENLMSCIKRQKDMTPKNEVPRLEGVQHATGEEWKKTTNSPRKKEATEPKRKWPSVVAMSADESKIWCCKE